MLGTLESQQRSEEAGTGEKAGGKKAAREEPCHQVAEEGLAGPGQAFAFYSELVAKMCIRDSRLTVRTKGTGKWVTR